MPRIRVLNGTAVDPSPGFWCWIDIGGNGFCLGPNVVCPTLDGACDIPPCDTCTIMGPPCDCDGVVYSGGA